MLDERIARIEGLQQRDALAVFGPILYSLEHRVRDAITAIADRKPRLVVILDTNGGIVEVVERMVGIVRHFYSDVQFIVPDKAMSAGTVFAMSGDSILMDYFSVLGPIDPQVVKDNKLVPALSYLVQYKRLVEKDRAGELTSAEYALLSKLDLAELHQYEQARNLSVELLKKWLATYKFKEWKETETEKTLVTEQMKVDRATLIANALSDNEKWFSHGRGISRDTLQGTDIKLKIDDLEANRDLQRAVREYHHCLSDYMVDRTLPNLVHSRAYF